MTNAKDLTKEAPRSPRVRLGNFVILARTIDKGRALLNGQIGEYKYDCPLDNDLFSFIGISGSQLLELLKSGADDTSVVSWIMQNGTSRTHAEIAAWSDETERYMPDSDPEMKDWFLAKCSPCGLNPSTTSLFDWLEFDDRASYAQQ